MYEPLLLLHSWNRWIVLLATIYFTLRALLGCWAQARWTQTDTYFISIYNQIFGYQVMLGLALWAGLSPLTKAAFRDPTLILQNGMLTFWALRHPITMALALGVFHLGKARSKKVPPTARFEVLGKCFLLVLFLILSAIPRPWLSYGRSLF